MTKDCGHHGKCKKKLRRRLLAGILIFLFLVLLAVLIVWLVLRPTKPTFVLQDATVYAFNVSSAPASNVLNSTLQITLVSRNPNDRVGIYYDRLDVYASYRSQQITPATRIGPVYQGHKDVDVWSPFLVGADVPVAPYIGAALAQDLSAGMISVLIKADGRVRWKAGSLVTRGYHLHVTCPAFISFGSRSPTGVIVPGGGVDAVKYQLSMKCSISV